MSSHSPVPSEFIALNRRIISIADGSFQDGSPNGRKSVVIQAPRGWSDDNTYTIHGVHTEDAAQIQIGSFYDIRLIESGVMNQKPDRPLIDPNNPGRHIWRWGGLLKEPIPAAQPITAEPGESWEEVARAGMPIQRLADTEIDAIFVRIRRDLSALQDHYHSDRPSRAKKRT